MNKHIKNVAVCICHDGNGRILFQQRGSHANDYTGHWDFGGGSVEFGEFIEVALMREVQEEYGCTNVTIEQTLPIAEHIQDGIHCILHPFIVRVIPTEVAITEINKISNIGWHTRDDLPGPLHPGCERYLMRCSDQLQAYIYEAPINS